MSDVVGTLLRVPRKLSSNIPFRGVIAKGLENVSFFLLTLPRSQRILMDMLVGRGYRAVTSAGLCRTLYGSNVGRLLGKGCFCSLEYLLSVWRQDLTRKRETRTRDCSDIVNCWPENCFREIDTYLLGGL